MLARSSSETGSLLAVGLPRLNQNKKYQGWAACQYSLIVADIGFYADTFLQTLRHGGLRRLLAELGRINSRGYNLDTGRHHHYTAKPSHLLLSTSLSSLQQQRATLGLSGDVMYGFCVCVRVCLVCGSKANRTCLGHAVMCWDRNSPICGIHVLVISCGAVLQNTARW